jgi:hypothetical protein
MSIDDALPKEWDALRKSRYYDNRSFDIKDATCVLQPDHHEMMRRSREIAEEDNVNKPAHYRVGEVEAIDYIQQQLGTGVKDYLLGNVHKYLHRHRFKGQALEDLKKTEWYLRRLIMEEEQGG